MPRYRVCVVIETDEPIGDVEYLEHGSPHSSGWFWNKEKDVKAMSFDPDYQSPGVIVDSWVVQELP